MARPGPHGTPEPRTAAPRTLPAPASRASAAPLIA